MDVLVYVDPSPRGEWALAAAAQLAAAARFTLLATDEDAAADPALLTRARERLGAPATLSTRPGPAERAVAVEAAARAWGLLVVPPAGRGAVARMLRGSRVATVVRSVRAPVLVARRPPQRFERLLGALSGRASTGLVIEAALFWERATEARASFVHIQPEVALPHTGADAEPAPAAEAVQAALRAAARDADLELREGLVVDEVLDAFETGAFQLLVIGARDDEESGFGREDVTERLLLRCPGSTLIVGRR
jgi:nucleotide-binding universal stress UspA family protein